MLGRRRQMVRDGETADQALDRMIREKREEDRRLGFLGQADGDQDQGTAVRRGQSQPPRPEIRRLNRQPGGQAASREGELQGGEHADGRGAGGHQMVSGQGATGDGGHQGGVGSHGPAASSQQVLHGGQPGAGEGASRGGGQADGSVAGGRQEVRQGQQTTSSSSTMGKPQDGVGKGPQVPRGEPVSYGPNPSTSGRLRTGTGGGLLGPLAQYPAVPQGVHVGPQILDTLQNLQGLFGGVFGGRDQGHQQGGQVRGQEGLGTTVRSLEPYYETVNEAATGPMVNPYWSPEVQRRALELASEAPMVQPEERDQGVPEQGQSTLTPERLQELRKKCLEEAAANFQNELKKLGVDPGQESGTSYQTAQSVPQGPSGTPVGPPPTPSGPPGLGSELGGGGTDVIGASVSVKSMELPMLPAVGGGDGSALQFGDWLAVIYPQMCDAAPNAKLWWDETLEVVRKYYDQWLTSSPLERLRTKPEDRDLAARFPRLEMKGVSTLLAALPDHLKKEMVAERRLSTVSIMARLFVVYQPGGGAERSALLRSLVEIKTTGSIHEVLGALRLWRRQLLRAEELGVTLPDGLILMTAMQKVADALVKLGGTQISYRISTVRQQLAVDIRPMVGNVKEFSEYLQAEAEDLALAHGGGRTTSGTTTSSSTLTSLKALASGDGSGAGAERGGQGSEGKGKCRFWGSDAGCRRAGSCKFLHSWEGLDKTKRCYGCSSTTHMKKDCVAGDGSSQKGQGGSGGGDKQAKKVSKGDANKGSKEGGGDGDGKKNQQTSSTTTSSSSSPGVHGRSQGDLQTTSRTTSTTSSTEKGIIEDKEDWVDVQGLLKSLKGEASGRSSSRSVKALLKSVKEDGCREDGQAGLYALLDGGATHALRQARPEELCELQPVEVELAFGKATVYKSAKHNSLLTREAVEPIIPLRMLVDRDFKISWSKDGCRIYHPTLGELECTRRHGCPVMDRKKALQLLDLMERQEHQEAHDLSDEDLGWWKNYFPEVPDEIWNFMKGQSQDYRQLGGVPWNRHKRRRLMRSKGVILHLFSGSQSDSWEKESWNGYEILSIDCTMGGQYNIHLPGVWAFLWKVALDGRLKAILGGPPCRTVSRLRHIPPGPRPLRGRDDLRFGLNDLNFAEQDLANSDLALLLKQEGLWLKAEEIRKEQKLRVPTAFLLESPEDPMEYLDFEEAKNLPSFWNFKEVNSLVNQGENRKVSFDQGKTGHGRRKPTTLLVNLPDFDELQGLRGPGRGEALEQRLEDRLRQTKSWAQWSPGLVAAIKHALRKHLERMDEENMKVSKMNLQDWKQHIAQQHSPYRRDCRTCLETMGVSEPHRRQKTGGSSYVLSADIIGPFAEGVDAGTGRKARYILIATVPIPRLGHLAREEEAVEDEKPEGEDPEHHGKMNWLKKEKKSS